MKCWIVGGAGAGFRQVRCGGGTESEFSRNGMPVRRWPDAVGHQYDLAVHVLFSCRPLTGHVQPLLPLAKEARRRGHVVRFAVAEPIGSTVRAMGYDSEPAGISASVSAAAVRQLIPEFDRLAPEDIRPTVYGRYLPEIEMPPRLADLDAVCARFRPDVLVHDVGEFAAPLAAATAGLPWVTVGFGPLLQPEVAEIAGVAVAPAWRRRGLNPLPRGGLYRHLYVDPFPPCLQRAEIATLPATVRLGPVGGAFKAPPARRSAPHRVYLTFGTLWKNTVPGIVETIRTVIAGTLDAGVTLTVTVGPEVDPAMLGDQPPSVTVDRFIPQDRLLPTCSGVVCHAGAGTMLGALAWGVPPLLLPFRADQFYNAEQARRAGVGLVLLPNEITRQAVTANVRRLLTDTELAARIEIARQELAAMPDVVGVVDRMEALIQSRERK
jgi:UDP:flavonoid glycosyltransferase YjiC (YdhE family)